LFSGEYWTGGRAKELGLVDAIGDLRATLRDRYGEKVKTPLVAERGWFGRRAGGILGARIGGADLSWGGPNFAEDIVSALEARAIWARYGL
jgi:serine protease SohB